MNTELVSRIKLVMIMMLISAASFGQNRYMVFFKDKNGTPFTVNNPTQFISQKALDRRIKEDILVTEQDLPVNPSYVQQVKNAGADIFFTTRWMNGLLIQCEPTLLTTIQNLPCVDHVEFVAPQARLSNSGRRNMVNRKKNTSVGFETQTQLHMLGIPEMHADNFIGQGVTIAIFDGGFPGVSTTAPFQSILAEGRINLAVSHDFVSNSKNVFQYDEHGTEVFSTIAAFVPDSYTGGAYKANYQLYVTEDGATEFRVEEYNWMFAAERADSAGVDIISSSLGYYDFDMSSMNYSKSQMDGKTAVVTKAAQWAADRGIVVVCSAGNEGNVASWRIITAPADAAGVIAVANVNAQGVPSSSSSIGPSADGRIKPDLAALGTGVRVFRASGAIASASGTSLSTPLVTSLVAGVLQRFPQLTSKQIIETLKMSASKATSPDFSVGYGIPNYTAVVNYLEQSVQQNIFEVFPNPTSDTLLVRPFDPTAVTSCTVELLSPQGQLLGKDTVRFDWLNRNYQTNLSELPPGFYYLRVSFNAQRFIFKVVKT